MVEIFFVLQTAIGAVNAIREGCQMLAEGKAEIDKFKSQVEGGVANAKASGFWACGQFANIYQLLGAENLNSCIGLGLRQTRKRCDSG